MSRNEHHQRRELREPIGVNYYIQRLLKLRFFIILDYLDKHVRRNLNKEEIETRPSTSNGVWCCVLLPTILVTYSLLYRNTVSLLYKLLACLSTGLFLSGALFVVFMSVSCSVLRKNVNAGWVASSLTSTLLMYQVLYQDLITSLIYSFLSVYMFSALMSICLKSCPKTFTLGEALIVVQGIVLTCFALFFRVFLRIGDTSDKDMSFLIDVYVSIFLTAMMVAISLFILDKEKREDVNLYLAGFIGLFGFCTLHIIAGSDCIKRFVYDILYDIKRIQLILLWLLLTAVAVASLYFRTKMNVKATTVMRKVFHILASLVFMSGILQDVCLMTFTAGIGFIFVILAEALRKSDIEIVSPFLQKAFKVFSDEKDCGTFAMTPVYLYVGLACPLVLVPTHKYQQLELLSGVLSVGVGDSAASWFGSNYGYNKWSEGDKTIEGTIFNILSQITVVFVLQCFGFLESNYGLLRTCFASTISSLVEAKTGQIDNLIIPLVTIIAFQMTYIVNW